jgi:hypothetical protein
MRAERFMDPRTILGPADWAPLQALVYALWGLVICNVTFAASMLLGHIVIPSMHATGHLKGSALAFRIPFTILAVLCLCGSAVMVYIFLSNLPITYDIYPQKII